MMKFLALNLVESATLSASTENAQFSLNNIKHDFRTKVYRSTSNSDSVVFDLGSIEDVDHVAICDNWKDGFGVTAVTIEANATDSWSSPSFSTSMTLDSTFGISIKELSSEQSYRFWRLVLTSTLGYCELSHVFIGKATQITTNGISYGWGYLNKDMKKTGTSRYGQEFTDVIGKRKELTGLSIKVANTTEIDKIFEVFDDRGTVNPFYAVMGDGTNTIISNENRLNGIYKFTTEPRFINPTAPGLYDITFSLREQK
jgi:hypothetical protein